MPLRELIDGGYIARILKDSMSPDGVRLTTMEVTYPRIVLAEFNTHRTKSRNSASSRAIPVEKQLVKILDNPFIPIYWGKNQKGMQAEQELTISEQNAATDEWLGARDDMVRRARALLAIGVHKQITNRLLEPFMWQTVICSATEWSNFFALRCHPDAQPEIRRIAVMMQQLYLEGALSCDQLGYGDWHLPLTTPEEILQLLADGFTIEDIKKISAGRCARVSYLTHDGVRDPRADIELCDRLRTSGHMSPLEHVARPMSKKEIELLDSEDNCMIGGLPFWGNYRGWTQYRKLLPYESNFADVVSN